MKKITLLTIAISTLGGLSANAQIMHNGTTSYENRTLSVISEQTAFNKTSATTDLCTAESQYSWKSGKWEITDSVTYTYNANNTKATALYKGWYGVPYNTWYTKYKYIYSYDANKNLTSTLVQYTNALKDTLRYSYSYDANNNQISEIDSIWEPYSKQFVKYSQYISTYDANKNLTSKLVQAWKSTNSGWAWVNDWQASYTYDGNGHLTKEMDQVWNNGAWVNDWQLTTTYTGNNLTSEEGMVWSNGAWTNYVKGTYTYDANNNKTTEVYQSWNAGAWANSSKSTSTYDVNNNRTSRLSQGWSGGAWVNSSVSYYYYSAANVTNINELSFGNDVLRVYPNPAVNELNIENLSPNAKQKLEIFNMVGQKIYSSDIQERRIIDMSAFPRGIYIVRMVSEKSEVSVQRFIKE